MFLKILLIIAVVLLILAIVVALQPANFRIVRSATIDAPASVVFANVNDFSQWHAWSPWEKMDPDMKRTFGSPTAGPGAVYSWDGNNKVGAGRMTIIESRPAELVRVKLEFFRPMLAVSEAEFTFKPEGDRTGVTWSMSGTNNFPAKAFGLIMNMDKLVGSQFAEGLANLKQASETGK